MNANPSRSLNLVADNLLCGAPEITRSSFTDPDVFFDCLFGTDWIQDVLAQEFRVNFITEMHEELQEQSPRASSPRRCQIS